MTNAQLKKILRHSEMIWLMKDGLFNAETFIHKEHLPDYFAPDKEESYRILGYNGVFNHKEPDMKPIFNKINNYTDKFKATYWVLENIEGKKKILYRRYDHQESGRDYLIISNVYYETLNLKTLLANETSPHLNPVCNQDRTIITMPKVIY